jgi:hypothetical protein
MSEQAKRYRAFISYSQKDKAYARRLHAALEGYRLPSGVEVEGLDAKRKLGRIFRDDDEMGAATDLGAALQGAIADAEGLIVICSPNAAQSQWVNEEILHFKRTGRADRIFAVIVAGEPTPPPQRADRECFPPALRFELGPDGALSDRPAEPLGLDVRKEPFDRLVVRLAAGLLGIAFDALWRREQRRARARTTMRAGLAAAVLAVGAALAYGWFSERLGRDLREARAEFAEGRLTEGLRRLQPYVGGPLHAQVAPTLQTVLGWAGRPVAEQVETAGARRLLLFQGRLIYADANGGFRDVSEIGHPPVRMIVASGRDHLIYITETAAFVLDGATGEVLSRVENENIAWDGAAVQTRDNSLLVFGVRWGSTNGSIWPVVLHVPPSGAGARSYRAITRLTDDDVAILNECEAVLAHPSDIEDAAGAWLTFPPRDLNTEYDPALYTPGVNDRIVRVRTPPPYNGDSIWDSADGSALLQSGCADIAADSRRSDAREPVFSIPQINSLSAISLAQTWREIPDPPDPFRVFAAPRPANEDDFIPGGGFGGDDYRDRYGAEVWRSPPNPRGMAPDSTTFDDVGGELIKYFMFIANSGIVWFACTEGDGGAQCMQLGAPHVDELEYGGPLYEDVRSPDGRYLALGRAGAMLDLQTRSVVNPAGDLPIGNDLAYDFSPDGAQFLIASAGQITAYRPNGAGGAWAPSGVVATLPSDSDGEQSSLAGLLALGGGRFIVVQRDGRLHRIGFGERTTWQTALRDVGGIRYSSDRRRFAIVAANGVQVFESATGLPMSGVMLPTDWEDFPVGICFFYVHVGDDGVLRVLCPVAGGAMGWTPTRFNGDIAQRLQGILCGDGAEPLEALRQCAAGATRR